MEPFKMYKIQDFRLQGRWKDISHATQIIPGSFYVNLGVSILKMINRIRLSPSYLSVICSNFHKCILQAQNISSQMLPNLQMFQSIFSQIQKSNLEIPILNKQLQKILLTKQLWAVQISMRLIFTVLLQGQNSEQQSILRGDPFNIEQKQNYLVSFCRFFNIRIAIVNSPNQNVIGQSGYCLLLYRKHTHQYAIVYNKEEVSIDLQGCLQDRSQNLRGFPFSQEERKTNNIQPVQGNIGSQSTIQIKNRQEIPQDVKQAINTFSMFLLQDYSDPQNLIQKMDNSLQLHPQLKEGYFLELYNLLRQEKLVGKNVCKHQDENTIITQCSKVHCKPCLQAKVSNYKCPCGEELSKNDLWKLSLRQVDSSYFNSLIL